MSPTAANGLLYMGSGLAGAVFAVDADTGRTVWKLQTPWGMYNDPGVNGAKVYAGGTEGILYALDAFTGAILWSTNLGIVASDPAVVEGTIYVVGDTNDLHALRESDGSLLWKSQLDTYSGGTPVVANGKVFVGTKNGTNGALQAFDSSTGELIWTFDHPVGSTPVVWGGLVFAVSDGDGVVDSGFYAVDEDTGELVWELPVDVCYSSPSVAGGVVYAGWASAYGYPMDGGLYALDATNGRVLGQWNMGGSVCSSPIVVNGWVYVGSWDTRLYAYNLDTGIFLSSSIGPPTTPVIIEGRDFGASETVDIEFDSRRVGVVQADDSGRFTTHFAIPEREESGRYRVRAVGQVSLRAAEAFFTVRADWPMLGYNSSRTSGNPYETMINKGSIQRLEEDYPPVWGGQRAPPSSVEAGSILYYHAGTDVVGYVEAHDAATRLDTWRVGLLSDNPSPPTVADGRVFFGEDALIAFDALSGAILWSYQRTGTPVSPAVVDGVVYDVFTGGTLAALDAQGGSVLWETAIPEGTTSSPAVINGTVYVGGRDGLLRAFSAASGVFMWSARAGDEISWSAPSIMDEVVYVGTADVEGEVVAFDVGSGDLLWETPVIGSIRSGLAVSDGRVYAGTTEGKLYALDSTTGLLVWMVDRAAGCMSTPAVAGGILFVGNRHAIQAFETDSGRQLWARQLENGCASPAIVNGRVFIGDDNGMHVFELEPPP